MVRRQPGQHDWHYFDRSTCDFPYVTGSDTGGKNLPLWSGAFETNSSATMVWHMASLNRICLVFSFYSLFIFAFRVLFRLLGSCLIRIPTVAVENADKSCC